MDPRGLHQLADAALSGGAFPTCRQPEFIFPQIQQSPQLTHLVPQPLPAAHIPRTSPVQPLRSSANQIAANLVEQMTTLLNQFGFDVTPHEFPTPPMPPTPPQASPIPQPSTIAPSEFEPRRRPQPIPQNAYSSGVDEVRVSLPATGQRTGAIPNSFPPASTTTAPPPANSSRDWDHEDRDLLLKS